MNKNIKVVVLGASNKPERYSFQAINLLLEHGYDVIPVNPSGVSICNLETKRKLTDIKEEIDTLTMYVSPSISDKQTDDIISLSPKRVLFNPGTENPELMKKCIEHNIEVEEACTLVLLKTDSFQH
ncbi:MAG: CoA-binding protein [bacterium]|nr:CoA-binding protein [bacterium]